MPLGNAGVNFAKAAADSLEELGALGDVEADVPSSDGESGAELEVNQPGREDGTEGIFDDLKEEVATNPSDDGSGQVDVPGVGQVSIDELVAGYMKNTDYTQKTQQLAADRQKSEKAEKLIQLLEDDPLNTIRQLAQSQGLQVAQQGGDWNRVEQHANSDKNGRDFTNSDLDALTVQSQVKEALKEALASDPDLQAARQQAVNTKVSAAFKTLEDTNSVTLSESDRTLILQTASNMGSTDLQYVYWRLNQDLETKMAKRKQLVDGGSQTGIRTSGETDSVSDEDIKSFDDALAAALSELKLEDIT